MKNPELEKFIRTVWKPIAESQPEKFRAVRVVITAYACLDENGYWSINDHPNLFRVLLWDDSPVSQQEIDSKVNGTESYTRVESA